MSIIGWIILGVLAGWIAGKIMHGGGYGLVGDLVLGILGALVGGWITGTLLGIDVTGLNIPSLIVAVVGACLLVAISRAIKGRRRADHVG
jgi:uncharacterized membrane protein YeaQ/YmgE (transglycosylase-associated protein family)